MAKKVKSTRSQLTNLRMQKAIAREKLEAVYYDRMADLVGSIPTFARDDDEGKWQNLTGIGKRVMEETDIKGMQETAIKLYYEDPGARGVIDTMVSFVLGKDAHITPVDESGEVKAWWAEFCKINKFDTKMKELVRRCFRDGESFIRKFKSKKIKGVPLIRFVEPDKLKDASGKHSFGIETDPNDVEDVKAYYILDSTGVGSERVLAENMIHTKILVDGNVKRGVSFLVGIAKYIVKYGSWLDDRIMLNKIRTMFNMIIKVTGITPEGFKGKFEDVSGKTPVGGTANKMMPKPGSVLVSTPGIDYEFKNLQIHAPDTAADGRLIELQIGKGTGLTEYVVRDDASNSNYSSTMVAESPMVRMFESWQDLFEKPFAEIFTMVIGDGIRQGVLKKGTSTECMINFTGLIHRDIKADSEAYQIQLASKLVSKRTVSEKLGYDYNAETELIAKEDNEESDKEFKSRENEEE